MKETLQQTLKRAPLKPNSAFKSAVDDALNRLPPRPIHRRKNTARLAAGLCAALVLVSLPLARWYIEGGRKVSQSGSPLAQADPIESPTPTPIAQSARSSVALAPGEIAYIIEGQSLVRTEAYGALPTGSEPTALQLGDAIAALQAHMLDQDAYDFDLIDPIPTPIAAKDAAPSILGADLDEAALSLQDEWEVSAEPFPTPVYNDQQSSIAVDMPAATTPDDAIRIATATEPDEAIRIPTIIESTNEQNIQTEAPIPDDYATEIILEDSEQASTELDIQCDLGSVSLRVVRASWNQDENVLTWVATIQGDGEEPSSPEDQAGFHGVRLKDILFRGTTVEPDTGNSNEPLTLRSSKFLPRENNGGSLVSQLKIDMSDSDQWGTLPITINYADDEGNAASVDLWVRFEEGKCVVLKDGNVS